ncbi:unnamed protein product [Caretta caretta]
MKKIFSLNLQKRLLPSKEGLELQQTLVPSKWLVSDIYQEERGRGTEGEERGGREMEEGREEEESSDSFSQPLTGMFPPDQPAGKLEDPPSPPALLCGVSGKVPHPCAGMVKPQKNFDVSHIIADDSDDVDSSASSV